MTGRRERKKQMTRQALLQAAIVLFGNRGFDGTRIEDITERVDLAKGAFYNYFDSKETLLAELIFQGIGILEQDHFSALDTADPVDGLVRCYCAFLDHHPEYLGLINQARGLLVHGRGGNGRLREALGDLLRRVASRLAPSNPPDQWTEDECLAMAALLAGGVTGYRSLRLAVGFSPATTASHQAIVAGLFRMMDEIRRRRDAGSTP
jgi:AcrR family transcriptional regulator